MITALNSLCPSSELYPSPLVRFLFLHTKQPLYVLHVTEIAWLKLSCLTDKGPTGTDWALIEV